MYIFFSKTHTLKSSGNRSGSRGSHRSTQPFHFFFQCFRTKFGCTFTAEWFSSNQRQHSAFWSQLYLAIIVILKKKVWLLANAYHYLWHLTPFINKLMKYHYYSVFKLVWNRCSLIIDWFIRVLFIIYEVLKFENWLVSL